MTFSLHVIRNDADLARGAQALAAAEPAFARIMDQVAPLPLRLRADGFAGILDIIVSQQVSTASAAAIWARIETAGLTSEAAVIAAGEDGLRAAGLSRPKARYALGVAEAGVDYDRLRSLPENEVIAQLCALKGIGPWTAEVYVMFCLGRADVFPSGDLALQEAAKVLFDLPARPSAAVLEEMARVWSPWRSVAARALFAYYRVIKARDGI